MNTDPGVCACVNYSSCFTNANIYFEGWEWEGHVYLHFV